MVFDRLREIQAGSMQQARAYERNRTPGRLRFVRVLIVVMFLIEIPAFVQAVVEINGGGKFLAPSLRLATPAFFPCVRAVRVAS